MAAAAPAEPLRRLHRPRNPPWWSQRSRFPYASFDDPPRSRLFLVLEQKVMTPEVWLRLSSFGPIEDFWPQVNKRTMEPTGAAFVKYASSADARRALREMSSLPGMEPGVVKICLAQSRVSEKSGNLNLEPHGETDAKVPKTSQAALATEECSQNKSSSLKTPVTNLTVSTEVKSPESRPEQETAICEVQGESLNTSDKSSSLKKPVINLTVSTEVKSPVSRPEQETAICEVQGKSLNTSGKSTSLDKMVTEPSKFSVLKSHVNSQRHQTTDHEVQENSLNPSDEHVGLDEPMISVEKETTSYEIKGSSLIPKVCKTTSIEPVTKTSESDTHKSSVWEHQRKIHRMQGSNLIVIGSVSHRTKAKPIDALTDGSFMNSAKRIQTQYERAT
ncbi:uncharacterized protein LOC121932411 isoform X3 [Sceloporus undulatus]|uniref:uncharacterized protein LOC121932411 isoform X3 n=1 Tax=Sceloporus undulatus TaxID=8520 RepID=UPI001C4D7E8D|nr:uncharacterized protein LOC121932411 isoform X3 [Sceloporus undulatus]